MWKMDKKVVVLHYFYKKHSYKKHSTMKSIRIYALLALLLMAGGATMQAQEWMSLLKDNSEWNILWQSTGVPTPESVTESLMVSGDTLVDGVLYKKVLRKLSSETQYWHGSLEYDLYGIIKEEESGKVFYKPIEQEIEYLLYDFGMNVNDTAVMYWCQNSNWEVHVRIDSIATQHIAGAERRVFYVSSKDMFGDEWHWLNTWVEGIGAMEGLLYSCHVVNAGGITLHELLCYHEDGELVWQNPNYNTCLIDPESIQDNTEESGLQVYPNPARDRVVIEGVEAAEVQVYNALGQLVKTVRRTNEIDLSGLVDGVYLLRITDAEGKVYTNKITVR